MIKREDYYRLSDKPRLICWNLLDVSLRFTVRALGFLKRASPASADRIAATNARPQARLISERACATRLAFLWILGWFPSCLIGA